MSDLSERLRAALIDGQHTSRDKTLVMIGMDELLTLTAALAAAEGRCNVAQRCLDDLL